ncbi:ATP-dependent DNA/RNA helicase DHX36-like isoform X2 [Macrosteles quadrilineatus]|uniref:ATP-dependent DNA/RNA helicase DHX36-like isoform X2 n=1 Tax=Macrosteles quadrilineatus TaxID=74068 RepID=UPI0023E35196|nr:ATP-dependent DNA/RNA helicase DHX36-like isoform X2 [Macrosteles quadrilineatus]
MASNRKKDFKEARPFGISKEERESISDETKSIINEKIILFINNVHEKAISFPSSYNNIERKLIHSIAAEHGLKSKSNGIEPNRFISVFKDTISFPEDILTLKPETLETLEQILSSNPVTTHDREMAVPKTITNSSVLSGRNQPGQAKPLIPKTDIKRTLSFRQVLPIYNYTAEIIDTIESGRITLIVGETGCGKTTQIPQLIMEFAEFQKKTCQILCSMPRRVAAVTISERVAFERGERIGDTVGYHIRLESRTSSETILTYCTNGVLLRSLLSGDQWLNNMSHIIIDEIHERDKLTDFTLIVLRDALVRFSHLKLIIMSATINTQKYKDYFKDCKGLGNGCNIVEVPGRTYKVTVIHLEHILQAVNYMSPEMAMEELKNPIHWPLDNTGIEPLAEKISKMDLDAREEFDSLLEEALSSGTKDVFKCLVNYINDHNIPVDYQHPQCGRTALMAAAIHSDVDTVNYLIQHKPDLTIVSAEGKTAQTYAEEVGDYSILGLLDLYLQYENRKKETTAATVTSDVPSHIQQMVDLYEKCHLKKPVDENLILAVLRSIHADGRDGAVLVFLPGFDQIMRVRDKIMENTSMFESKPLILHLLHSRMTSVNQKSVFGPPPPGHRKVILSTNIAETSVTINDVVFVIDCGKIKERGVDTVSGAYTLDCDWISQTCAEQRKGRAGRTSEGICFRLYTKKRYQSMNVNKIPEILREPLTELCLQAKQLAPTGTSISEFLGKALDPPRPDIVTQTINLLKQMDALNNDEELTELGRYLLDLSIDPRYGKMIVNAMILKCLDPVLTIVCCLSSGEMFKLPVDPDIKARINQKRLELAEGSFSDHLVYLNAYREWEEAASIRKEFKWCRDNFVSVSTMEMIRGSKRQILGQLKLQDQNYNQNSGNWAVVKAALTAGTYPNVAKVEQNKKCLRTRNELKVLIHLSSVLKCSDSVDNSTRDKHMMKSLPTDWLVYDESRQTGTFTSLCACTAVSPLTLWMFAGPANIPPPVPQESSEDNGDLRDLVQMNIDQFVKFTVDKELAQKLTDLRVKWSAIVNTSINNFRLKATGKISEQTVEGLVKIITIEDVPNMTLKQPVMTRNRYNPQSQYNDRAMNNPNRGYNSPQDRSTSKNYQPQGFQGQWREKGQNGQNRGFQGQWREKGQNGQNRGFNPPQDRGTSNKPQSQGFQGQWRERGQNRPNRGTTHQDLPIKYPKGYSKYIQGSNPPQERGTSNNPQSEGTIRQDQEVKISALDFLRGNFRRGGGPRRGGTNPTHTTQRGRGFQGQWRGGGQNGQNLGNSHRGAGLMRRGTQNLTQRELDYAEYERQDVAQALPESPKKPPKKADKK